MHSFYGTRLSENMAKTPEGYLICYDVNIARIGTQEYLGSELGVDEEVVVVNRPAEEVLKPATIASFEGKPFTNDHPYELLDVSNTSIYEKGHVQNVRISDDKTYIIADIMVKDAQTIRDIENGKRELSAGYNCDCMQDDDGNWYQCNIIGNHVALVDKGRAGNKVRINDNEWKEQDHPRDKDGKFTSGGGSNGSSNLSSDDKRGIDVALAIYGNKYKNLGNKGTPEASKRLREKVKNGEELTSEDISSIKLALKTMNSEEADKIANKLGGGKSGNGIKFSTTSEKDLKEKYGIYNIHEDSVRNEDTERLANKHGFEYDSRAEDSYVKEDGDNTFAIAEYKGDRGEKVFHCTAWNENTGDDGFQQIFIEADSPENAINYMENEFIPNYKKGYTEIKDNKEKPMKDTKTVLGKLLKAFAKDAEPEEMVEAIEAVKGEDVEPEGDKVAQLEAKVAELEAKLEKLYTAEKKEEQGEMHALDELEKELTDEEPNEDDPKEEIKDEDAKNDPKLIEAIAEKAQNDEETVEEIKKEIADAKKVIASIEDKDVRLAVADSFAKVIRGKMTSSENYKKLMDASKKTPVVDNKKVDYNETFKKIKENKFRK